MSKPEPARYLTTNWSAYNASLRNRGSLLIWLDKEMAWHAPHEGCPGRPPVFSDAAIQFCLSIKVLFKLPLRQTAGMVSIPLRRALPVFADPADLRHLIEAISAINNRQMTWLTTVQGAARSQKSVSAWFAASAKASGVQKSAHGLRATRAVMLAEAGATIHQIGAWTGHTSLSEIEHYSQTANRKRLLDGGGSGTENVQVFRS